MSRGKVIGEVFWLVVMVVCGFFIISADLDKRRTFTVDTVEIASIDLDNQLEGKYRGNFIYGYGNIGEKTYYVVYEILSDGGLFLSKLEAEKTIIYDTLPEGKTAYVEVKRNGYGRIVENRLYVPEGSVSQQYDLSLSGL